MKLSIRIRYSDPGALADVVYARTPAATAAMAASLAHLSGGRCCAWNAGGLRSTWVGWARSTLGPPERLRERAGRYAAAGVGELVLELRKPDLAEQLEDMAAIRKAIE